VGALAQFRRMRRKVFLLCDVSSYGPLFREAGFAESLHTMCSSVAGSRSGL
jgi:hypothetical protein